MHENGEDASRFSGWLKGRAKSGVTTTRRTDQNSTNMLAARTSHFPLGGLLLVRERPGAVGGHPPIPAWARRIPGWLVASVVFLTRLAAAADPAFRPVEAIVPAPGGLHHVFRLTERVYSGSQPESEDALAGLARLGITTVVSVDGALPDVEAARRHGLRYIHLPVGYDGISSNRVAQLAQAGSLPGKIYVHCHHGRHRGPAAAAIMSRLASGWSAAEGEAFLRLAGTAPDYAGLYRSVRELPRPASAPVGTAGTDLPERTPSTPVVGAMVEIDRLFDSLKKLGATGWTSPSPGKAGGIPSQVGRETAVLLWEQFRELGRHPDTTSRPAGYQSMLAEAETAAAALQAAWSAGPEAGEAVSATVFDAHLERLNQACLACHRRHRN